MGHHEFSRLPTYPTESEGNATIRSNRPRAFSPLELGLLVPLAVLAAALATFTIVYICQHGVVKPAAIAALCATGVLLLAVGYVVSRRMRKPDWCRDLESGLGNRWQTPALLPPSPKEMAQMTLASNGVYTAVPNSQPTTPPPPPRPTFANKVVLAVKKTFSPNLSSKSSWDNFISKHDDNERLIHYGDERLSTESLELPAEEKRRSLWSSVFELAGDARMDQLREANLKRLSRQELSAGLVRVPSKRENPGVKITLTKPRATASPPRSRRESFSDDISSRDVSLSFDPLRSNPFLQLSRDPSVRHTKSAQNLTTPMTKDTTTERVPRRPRSAEPKSRRGYDAAAMQLFADQMAGLGPDWTPTPPTTPPPASQRSRSATPRGLRKLPSPGPIGQGGRDLRTAYQVASRV